MLAPQVDQVELSAVQVLPGGDGFVLEVRNSDQQPLQLRFPVWSLRQLMRVLPRIDAALNQAQDAPSSAVLAYPVVEWTVEDAGASQGVAMCLKTDRNVVSGFAFDLDAALVLHRELGEAIARARARARAAAADAVAVPPLVPLQ